MKYISGKILVLFRKQKSRVFVRSLKKKKSFCFAHNLKNDPNNSSYLLFGGKDRKRTFPLIYVLTFKRRKFFSLAAFFYIQSNAETEYTKHRLSYTSYVLGKPRLSWLKSTKVENFTIIISEKCVLSWNQENRRDLGHNRNSSIHFVSRDNFVDQLYFPLVSSA